MQLLTASCDFSKSDFLKLGFMHLWTGKHYVSLGPGSFV